MARGVEMQLSRVFAEVAMRQVWRGMSVPTFRVLCLFRVSGTGISALFYVYIFDRYSWSHDMETSSDSLWKEQL